MKFSPERASGMLRSLGARGAIVGTVALTAAVVVACHGPKRRSFSVQTVPAVTYVSGNGSTNAGTTTRFDVKENVLRSFKGGANEGIAIALDGTAYHVASSRNAGIGNPLGGAFGKIRVVQRIRERDRQNNDAFDANQDRDILLDSACSKPTAISPRGIALVHSGGFVLVALNAIASSPAQSPRIVVYGTSSAGNVPPVSATTNLGGAPWDLAYDQQHDRLFIARTDGAIAVYDNYAGGSATTAAFRGADAPDRVIIADYSDFLNPVPSRSTSPSEVNFHGIAYDPEGDRIIVSDVGLAASPSDGKIVVFAQASTIGTPGGAMVKPQTVISGNNTLLGNPVDIALLGKTLYIAEKSNNKVLIYNDVFGRRGDTPADRSVAQTAPEAVFVETLLPAANFNDVSDLGNSDSTDGLMIVSNPKNGATDNPPGTVAPEGSVTHHRQLGFTDTPDSFNLLGNLLNNDPNARNLQNSSFDGNGDGFFTFDDGSTGGILVVNRMSNSRVPGISNNFLTRTRDRIISGSKTKLVTPKGIEISNKRGLIIVAEKTGVADSFVPNSPVFPRILAFSTSASGNVDPILETANTGRGAPWDLDYDPTNDRLFVSSTAGEILVYDNYSEQGGKNGPDRVIIPSGGNKLALFPTMNLHGIVFVDGQDVAIVTDVGDAANATDGRIYVISGVSTASGNVTVDAVIAGSSTLLGNPVDCAFNGSSLFVAEKSNSFVLRFDGILTTSGGNVAPSVSTAKDSPASPESVTLIPTTIGGGPATPTMVR